jgi:TonB family protein
VSFLADLAIRSTVILAIGLAASALLRGRSAALRHFVLAAAVFAAGAAIPLTLILPAWELPWPAPAASPRPPLAVSASRQSAPPTIHGAVQAGRGPDAGQAGAARDREKRQGHAYLGSSTRTILALVPTVWAGGVLFAAAMLLSACGRMARIARRAERLLDGPWVRCAAVVSAAYGLRREVVVLQTDATGLLATWGLFRPRVLLPARAGEWTDERVRVVLCHELAHIRRHDWAVQIAAEALRTIYWFNPLVWIACARLRRDGEQACDDVVLDAGVPSREYAAHLLDLARLCRRPSPRWAAATPMARPSTLERRIAAMLNPRLDHKGLSRRATIATGVLLLAVTLPAAAVVRPGQNALRPLEGSVYDPTGGVLPGVELKLEDAGQIKWQSTSDASGRFEFPPVQSGKYVLEAAIPGFRPLRHEFELRNARDWDRAITLQVGDVRETILVKTQRTAGPAPAAAPAPRPVRVGGNIRVPRKIHHVAPLYPKSMSDAGREGEVPLEAVIGRDGTVQTVRVLSANVHPDFAIAAADAVRQWRFDPTLLNGVPVDVVMTVTVSFTLSE